LLAGTLLPLLGCIVTSEVTSHLEAVPELQLLQNRLWDAVVVGAGPAGSMSAHQLCRLGKAVLLLDRKTFPRRKVCGATISPGVPVLLARMGLPDLLEEAGAQSLQTLQLGGWNRQARLSLNGSMALSRSVLDSALVRAAMHEGAVFCSGARARLGTLLGDRRCLHVTVGVKQLEIPARLVIAADGLASGLMAEAGWPSRPSGAGRRLLVGIGAAFPPSTTGFEAGVIHMAVGQQGYVGLVREEDGSLNVAAALDAEALKRATSPEEVVNSLLGRGGWPALPNEGDSGTGTGRWKGTPGLTRRPGRLGADRLLAVGDAAGYIEPFTGEGVLWGLAGAGALAPLAARATERWTSDLLREWVSTHQRMMGRAQRLCRLTSWTLTRPILARSALRLLVRHPWLAGPFIRRVGSPIPSLT
jgi:flavin-dependent dehydrogenase